ncbi:MAG TPA: hypothetical protein GXZ98_04005 [Firmicutes bacterium]|jgi:hypothetical protein|nr:hypothetical protein [Bacillota bacterium]
MKKIKLAGFLLSLLLFSALGITAYEGNEGPIDESAVMGTGNLTLLEAKEIILAEELLHITLDRDFAHIYAYYEFSNPGVETEVLVGFPVDFLLDSERYGLAWQEECFPYYQMADETGSLPIQIYPDEKPQIAIVDGRKRDLVRKWYVTNLKLAANSRKQLVVEYAVRCSLLDMDSVATFFPSFSDRLLTYSFLPAGGWENDLIRKLRIVVDARANLERGGELKSLNFPQFNTYGGLYIFETTDFDLKELYALKILYNETPRLMTELITTYQINREQIAGLRAVSEETAYPLVRLFDEDLRTPWITEKGDTPEQVWLEVELKDFCLQAVGLVNGFFLDDATYATYARVKKIKVQIEQERYDFLTNRVEKRLFEEVVELADEPYLEVNEKAFAPLVSILADLGQSFNKTSRLRLTILETYPGTINQIALGELFLLGYKNDQDFPVEE